MPQLDNWTAKRAGGRITVYHATGKVPHIDKIEIEKGAIVATAADGKKYRLAWGTAA